MADDYAYSVVQCDVAPEKRDALQSYRDKRRMWRLWIDTDEYHAIQRVLTSTVWIDVAFKTLTHFAMNDTNSALNNTLLGEALIDGHVATQVLAIRRLVDDGNDIISLRRLVKDIRRNFGLFTRQNYVCFDGLPYDYDAVIRKEMIAHVGKGPFWGQTSGPSAHGASRRAHEQFDRLAGIEPENRSREDQLPKSLMTTIERWLDESGADELAKWSHAYLAHAGAQDARKRSPDALVTADKIADAIRALARVTEAISAYLLLVGGLSNNLMPVAQFSPFDKLDKPIMQPDGKDEAYKLWHSLSDERNHYLDGIEDELIGRAKSDR
jgi:hypothetical protein